MKRIATIASVFIAASILLSSCVSKNDYGYTPPANNYRYAFSDDFNNDANQWSFTDNQNRAYVSISGGQLHYDYHPANSGTNTVAIATGMPNGTSVFDIQTRFQSDNAMALVFGVSPSDYGYSFFIDDRGYFAVYDEGTSTIAAVALIDWSANNAVLTGWNNVEVEATPSGSWIGYVNGTQVFQIPAHTLYGNQTGYMVLNNTSGDADYLDLKW
ncbi:MAG: hypothetical protein ABI378_03720 [Chitinophagaceae bacterium]